MHKVECAGEAFDFLVIIVKKSITVVNYLALYPIDNIIKHPYAVFS